MCNAIPIALLLTTLFGALTLLRLTKNENPNSDLLCSLINQMEDNAPTDQHTSTKSCIKHSDFRKLIDVHN